MNRRRCAAAAITLACAFTMLSLPGLAHQAYAAPAPPVPSAALPTVAPPPYSMPPTAGKKTLDDVRREIDALYRKAASATDAYNLAAEQTDQQSADVVRLTERIVEGQVRIDDLKARAGAAARSQYQSGGLPPEAQFVLTSDPQLFLDGLGRLQQGQKATKDLLAELTGTQEDLTRYTADASTQWQRLETARVKKNQAKKEITEQIAAARKLEAGLEKEQRAELVRLEQAEATRAQSAWLGSGAVRDISSEASAEGKRAIAFATGQIGKPYVWGAEGPSSYDCSGLTSQAWAAAGRHIPRTSQEQWRLLPRVPIEDMRPGDLVIYFQDASHVGMYVGDGSIVHAPRPGRNVTLTGAGSMDILGVVRPDL